MAKLSDDEIFEMHTSWIEIRGEVEKVIPRVEKTESAIRELQDAQLQEQGRIDSAAHKAVVAYAGRKGQKVRDWMPLLVAIVASGLLFLGTVVTSPKDKPISMDDLRSVIQSVMREDKP